VQAAIFSDETAQSISIAEQVTLIEESICGFHPGHQEEHNITLLDGTGVGL
jgi:hypothetical protein